MNDIPSFADAIPAGPMVPAAARLRFSLDGVPERDRRPPVCRFLGLELTRSDIEPDGPLRVDGTLKVLPGLTVMSGHGHGFNAVRSRDTLAAEASDDVGLAINLGGPMRMTRAAQELVLDAGEAVLVSLEETYSFTNRRLGGLLALRIPRAQIAPLVTGVDDLRNRRISGSVPALKFLLDYLEVAEGEQWLVSSDLQQLFTRHVYELMALAIGATRDAAELARGRGLKAARLQAIKSDIGGNIDRPDLSVNTLAARHGLTPRALQRLFEAEGTTFTGYLVLQRLARAHGLLSDLGRSDDKISAIAWDCGFGDISHFNHLFRRQYGLAPSDVREQARLRAQ